jgi:hypothetical protein
MYAFELTTATDFANRTMGFRTTRCRAALTTPLFVSLGVCVLAISCQREGDTIWSAELRSPDGRWIARARTIENSGFGTGSIQTNVYLKRTSGSTSPETILSFFHDASPGGRTINLAMKWETPSHLEVTYDGHANLGFQVVKDGGIDISVRDFSSTEALSPDGRWLASARTTRWFGPGTPGEETNVYLERNNKDSHPPEKVLGFSHDATASQAGTVHLTLKWVAPTHLEATYDGHAAIDVQVVKYDGVDISVQDSSGAK